MTTRYHGMNVSVKRLQVKQNIKNIALASIIFPFWVTISLAILTVEKLKGKDGRE